MPSTSDPDDLPTRAMDSPAYPAAPLGSPAAYPPRTLASPSFTPRPMETPIFPPRTSDSSSLSTKLEAPPSPPAYPPRSMDMPYGQRPLPEHPMGYSNYSPGSFPPSSGPYGPPPVSFASLPPSFTPSSLTPSLPSTPGFPPSGATGSPPLEAFVQLLLAMNVEDQLKCGYRGSRKLADETVLPVTSNNFQHTAQLTCPSQPLSEQMTKSVTNAIMPSVSRAAPSPPPAGEGGKKLKILIPYKQRMN
ncbi:vegetative cell wall protein gp1-like [Penaeus monodon]|uniref:vegetative cell wall protein gp1-like n=1 Tax=Penaeus monodon TaxID=6687 RepID=UPI0018A73531|nr:vegetative cell wall protein gp1-like [Penaeus monodon]